MSVLVDTNVLLVCIQRENPLHASATAIIDSFLSEGEVLYVLHQNIAELWNVCTRPSDKNGLGLTVAETNLRLGTLENICMVLHENESVYYRWRRLIVRHGVRGVQVHDARIAAAMQEHEISKLLTYNAKDFKRFDGIAAVSPNDRAGS
jgi:predicted nucleic acid-binding protein